MPYCISSSLLIFTFWEFSSLFTEIWLCYEWGGGGGRGSKMWNNWHWWGRSVFISSCCEGFWDISLMYFIYLLFVLLRDTVVRKLEKREMWWDCVWHRWFTAGSLLSTWLRTLFVQSSELSKCSRWLILPTLPSVNILQSKDSSHQSTRTHT